MLTSPTRGSSSHEGHRPRSPQARHPRSAGGSRTGIVAEAGLPCDAGARRQARRARTGRRRRDRGTGSGRTDVRGTAREPSHRERRDPARGQTDVTETAPLIAVIVFPGSNDDRDAVRALELVGGHGSLVWHADAQLPPDTAGVVLPGGFSYGDYLRCGAIARFAPVMDAVRDFAASGGPVLGICNGFQILCEAGLLPGVLRPNASLSFVCKDVTLHVERADAPFTSRCESGQRLVIPVKHHDGAWYGPPELVAELEERGQILLRYEENPNGAVADVAGV